MGNGEGRHNSDYPTSADKIDRALSDYRQTEKGKKVQAEYQRTEKGKKTSKRYADSQKGKLTKKKYYHSPKGQKAILEKSRLMRDKAREVERYLEANPGKTLEDFYKEVGL